MEENRVLKGQLGKKRLLLTDDQRRRLAARGKILGRRLLAKVTTIVTPDTILRWHHRHCVSCHGATEPAGDLDLTGIETRLFMRSYENIIKRGLLTLIRENHPEVGNAKYLPAHSLRSHASRLVDMIRDGKHHNVDLPTEDRVRLTRIGLRMTLCAHPIIDRSLSRSRSSLLGVIRRTLATDT